MQRASTLTVRRWERKGVLAVLIQRTCLLYWALNITALINKHTLTLQRAFVSEPLPRILDIKKGPCAAKNFYRAASALRSKQICNSGRRRDYNSEIIKNKMIFIDRSKVKMRPICASLQMRVWHIYQIPNPIKLTFIRECATPLPVLVSPHRQCPPLPPIRRGELALLRL